MKKSLKLSRRLKVAVILLLLFLAWIFLAPYLAKRLIVEKPLEKADAILILGGSSVYLERTQKAAELFKKGVAPKILLTDDGGQAGWSQAEQRNPRFVDLARKNLIENGVPPEKIEILEPPVAGTIDEARILMKKARAENLRVVLLVTSAYHTRRALRTFETVFVENAKKTDIGIVSPPAGEQTPTPSWWWLSAFGWQMVAGEYVKNFGYWLYY